MACGGRRWRAGAAARAVTLSLAWGGALAGQAAMPADGAPAVGRWAGPSACVEAIPAATLVRTPIVLQLEPTTPVPPALVLPLAMAAQRLAARVHEAAGGAPEGGTPPALDSLVDWRAIAFGASARLHLGPDGLRWPDGRDAPAPVARLLERAATWFAGDAEAAVPWLPSLDPAGVDVAIALVPETTGPSTARIGTLAFPRIEPAVVLPGREAMKPPAWVRSLETPLRLTMEWILDRDGEAVRGSMRPVGPWQDPADAAGVRRRAEAVQLIERSFGAGSFTALRLGGCAVPHRVRQVFQFSR